MTAQRRIGRRIKLKDLEILHAAASAGSMAKAARDLSITQPAVSYSVSELEHALGVTLLERTAHGVVPTAYGQVLLDRSRVAMNEIRHGVEEIGALGDISKGHLRLGVTPPMTAVASAILNQLARDYPGMTFTVVAGATDHLLEALRRRDIELMISRLAGDVTDQDLSVEHLFHDELAVICSKANKLARRRDLTLRQLADESWVLPSSRGFLTQIIRAAFAEEGLEIPRATITTQSTYALSVLVANGPFLAIHPRTMLTTPSPHPQLAAVDVRLRSTRTPICLISFRGRSLSPVGALFQRLAKRTLPGRTERKRKL